MLLIANPSSFFVALNQIEFVLSDARQSDYTHYGLSQLWMLTYNYRNLTLISFSHGVAHCNLSSFESMVEWIRSGWADFFQWRHQNDIEKRFSKQKELNAVFKRIIKWLKLSCFPLSCFASLCFACISNWFHCSTINERTRTIWTLWSVLINLKFWLFGKKISPICQPPTWLYQLRRWAYIFDFVLTPSFLRFVHSQKT